MKKISRIKLFFAALPFVVIALLLFIRWNAYGRSYKSRADWGNEYWMGTHESEYYKKQINRIIKEWQKAGKENYLKSDTTNSFLHFDLDNKSIWLEENGVVEKENHVILNYNSPLFILRYFTSQKTIELPKRVILQIHNPNEKLSGQFRLYFGPYMFVFDNTTCTNGDYSSGTIQNPMSVSTQQSIDYKSMIVSEDEYKKYEESLEMTNQTQFSQVKISEEDTLKKNKSNWLKTEKLLIMEISGQLQNAGYELDSLEIETCSDYTGAYALIRGHGRNIIEKLLRSISSSITVRAYLKIDYLGDDIWYTKTAPHPNQKLESDRKLNLEFLIYPQEQITRSQYRKYIKLGRKAQQIKE